LAAFPAQLDENTDRESLSLKYYVRSINGKCSWVGLRAAKGSVETWEYLMVNGLDIVEVGVFTDKIYASNSLVQEPITGKDGGQINVNFYLTASLDWVEKPPSVLACVPPSFEVGIFLIYEAKKI